MRLLFLIPALLAAAMADAVELRNALGEDQRSETIRVEIDGHEVEVLRVDGKRARAALPLPLAGLIDASRRFVGKHFVAARSDLVLDYWQDEYPSVLRASGRCAPGKLPYAFPQSQWQVLLASSLEDNLFLAMINYQDDIVGETQCMSFDRELAYGLHDQLYEQAGDVLYLLGDEEAAIALERGHLDGAEAGLWLHFDEIDE